MTNEELLLDTNQLLRKLFEIDEQNRAQADESRASLKKQMEEVRARQAEAAKSPSTDLSVQEPAPSGAPQDWETRQKVATESGKARMEEMRALDQKYKEEVLEELRKQSEILKQIAERLGL